MLKPNHPERIRSQEENHVRHLDLQVLDALLRIEEVLNDQLKMMGHLAQHLKAKTVEVSIPSLTGDTQPKSTKKNPRSL